MTNEQQEEWVAFSHLDQIIRTAGVLHLRAVRVGASFRFEGGPSSLEDKYFPGTAEARGALRALEILRDAGEIPNWHSEESEDE